MSHLSLFLNSRIEGSGALAWIGDKGLAPFRYLFNGNAVCITQATRFESIDGSRKLVPVTLDDGSPALEIHHVASFHKNDDRNYGLHTSSTSKIKAFLSIVFLIPGLVLSVFKLLAYCFSDMRQRHNLVKEHFTPINREIGTAADPITDIKALQKELDAARDEFKHQPTNALIIHGDGNLEINEDPGILALNPMKLILEGARIVHKPSFLGRLDDAMWRTGKWQISAVRVITGPENVDDPGANVHGVSSVEEALAVTAPRRDWTSCKRYHMIFTIARLQQVATPT